MIRRLLDHAVDLLYPRSCAGCGRVGQSYCAACRDSLRAVSYVLASRTLAGGLDVLYVGEHRGLLRDAIHAYKFAGDRGLADILGAALDDGLLAAQLQVDVIVPVPLHTKREAWRGYNQSALLADVLAQNSGIPMAHLLHRHRHTGTQVGRNAAERQAAMAGAFSADEAVAGQRVLLVDDVVTTGSTLVACSEALYAAGALHVVAACVASA